MATPDPLSAGLSAFAQVKPVGSGAMGDVLRQLGLPLVMVSSGPPAPRWSGL